MVNGTLPPELVPHRKTIELIGKKAASLSALQAISYQLKMFDMANNAVGLDLSFHRDAVMCAITVTYGRIFSEGRGGHFKMEKSKILLKHLPAHEEIMAFRNGRYAHNGDHPSHASYVQMAVNDDEVVKIMPLHKIGLYSDDIPTRWRELFAWLYGYLIEQQNKHAQHLSGSTGQNFEIAREEDKHLFQQFA